MQDPIDAEAPSLRSLVVQLVGGLSMLVAVFAGLAWLLREPLEGLAALFVKEFGLVGVFVSVAVVDALPLTHEPILFLAWSGGLGFVPVWLTASAGSVLSGVLGWLGGRVLGQNRMVVRWLERNHVASFLHRYGAWAVAIAALTPFPYGLATWGSGAVGLPLRPVLLGALFRIPKVLVYLALIAWGWSLPDALGGP